MPPGPWPAPAKINLFLHVTGRRADGYHQLQTLFQFLDYGDEISFRITDDGVIARENVEYEVSADSDLVVRAAQALQQAAGSRLGARIGIRKRIPLGGGLGGGSSNAATVLVALNRLWNTGMTVPELMRLGLALGADVPVFVQGRAAWAEGVGEVFTPVDPPEDWYLVVYPGCQVATAEVFNTADLTRHTAPITISDFLAGRARNDCEAVALRAYPEIARASAWLRQRAGNARMTGTGSCVFARFDDPARAREVLHGLPGEWRGFTARGRNRSPLMDRLAAGSD